MLLESIIVHVPAQPERDADINEFGHLSTKTMAAFGEAACEAGAPDFEGLDAMESATDAIANILHWINEYHSRGPGVAPDPIEHVLESARLHFEEESAQ